MLVTGAHRLAAAKQIGLDKIECYIFDDDDENAAKRWEIAENLHRSELTALERDNHVAEWIRLTEEAETAVSPQPVAKPGRPSSGVRKAAKEINVNREDARRAVKVDSLTDEAKAVAREVGLDDNRSALLAARRVNQADSEAE